MTKSICLPLILLLAALHGAAKVSAEEAMPLLPGEAVREAQQGRFVHAPERDDPDERTTSNPVLWQQYQALRMGTAGQVCSTCGGRNCDRCGCQPSMVPWLRGSGRCDNWCVGPHWAVEADVLIMFREDADWGRIADDVGLAPDFADQFDVGPGARLFVTGYNEQGYGLQVGYEGINEWNASMEFDQPGSFRRFEYETKLNSVEINFLPLTPNLWKPFAGIRFVQLDEKLSDGDTVDKVIPLPDDPPAPPAAYVDTFDSYVVRNKLLGFQLGVRRDAWELNNRLSVQSFANAGLYINMFTRRDTFREITTVIYGDDISTPTVDEFAIETTTVSNSIRRDFNELAFLGEAGITATLRLNRCLALRSGYQVMVIDGVGEAMDAYFAQDLTSRTALFHGLQFGLEYRR